MKQDNSQNTSSNDIAIPSQVEAILKLLGADEKGLQSAAKKVSSGIDGVLKVYESAQDEAIAKLKFSNESDRKTAMKILALDSSAFGKLDKGFKNDLDIGKEALKSSLEQGMSFLDAQRFIEKNFESKYRPSLRKFYREHVRNSSSIYLSSIEKQLLDLDEQNTKLYKKVSSKLVEQRNKQLVLKSAFTTHFTKTIQKNPSYCELSETDRDSFDISIFQKYLGIQTIDMTEDILTLILSLREMIKIKSVESDIEGGDELGEEDEDTLDSSSETDDSDAYTSYTPLFSGEGTIDMGAGQSIKLTEKEMEMNDKALENYVTAVKICRDLGLGFVFKHKHQFLSNICGIDYTSGEGISEAKLLKVLNKLGKKIGIPEKSFVDQNTEDAIPKIGCFKTLGEAKYQFRDIQDTGIVGGKSYDPMKSDRSVAERVLIQKGFFDLEGKGFLNIKNW